jgi:hypothetical protein
MSCLLACGNKRVSDVTTGLSEQGLERDTLINFENVVTGSVPAGFTQTYTGEKQTLDWRTVSDSGNIVMAQSASNRGDNYNLLVLDRNEYQNVTLSVRIKAIAGEEDQGGGLIWRYVDNDNYYLARYNPLEKNFRIYRVINGNRKQLKSVHADNSPSTWFTVTIETKGDNILCKLNGSNAIEIRDDTFRAAGKVGLWTKADAVTYFDDLQITTLK